MKKILFLLLIFVIKLSAYEYLVYDNPNDNRTQRYFIDNSQDILLIKNIFLDGTESTSNDNHAFYNVLSSIKGNGRWFINNNEFSLLLKNDLNLLNDFYSQRLNPILNYFYNDTNFNQTNYILYENYELLYNSDGLVVESKVNDIWAGLYDDTEINKSGNLYNANGELIYINGLEVNWFQKEFDKFGINKVIKNSLPIFGLVLGGSVLVVLFVVLIERFTDFSLISIIGRLGK